MTFASQVQAAIQHRCHYLEPIRFRWLIAIRSPSIRSSHHKDSGRFYVPKTDIATR
jgi:hypothetical protein